MCWSKLRSLYHLCGLEPTRDPLSFVLKLESTSSALSPPRFDSCGLCSLQLPPANLILDTFCTWNVEQCLATTRLSLATVGSARSGIKYIGLLRTTIPGRPMQKQQASKTKTQGQLCAAPAQPSWHTANHSEALQIQPPLAVLHPAARTEPPQRRTALRCCWSRPGMYNMNNMNNMHNMNNMNNVHEQDNGRGDQI